MKFGFNYSRCFFGFVHIFQCEFLVQIYSLRYYLNSYFKSDGWNGVLFATDFMDMKGNSLGVEPSYILMYSHTVKFFSKIVFSETLKDRLIKLMFVRVLAKEISLLNPS